MSELDELRAEIRRKRQAATNKVGRLRRVNYANIEGTSFDPRKTAGAERRMNTIQARAYLRKLNAFNDRRTQYFGGQDGVIFQRHEWNRYKAPERATARAAAKELQRLGKLKRPDGYTVKEFTERVEGQRFNTASNRPLSPRNRSSKAFKSLSALSQAAEFENSRRSAAYKQRSIESGRTAARKMAAAMGDSARIERINKLSDERFYIAWHFGGLAEEMSLGYVEGQSENLDIDISDSNAAFMDDILDWAEGPSIAEYAGEDEAPVKRKGTKRKN